MFCAPEAAGQEIASRLYDAVEAAAREQGIRSLFTEASELARRLFERKGFAVVERQDLVIRGVADVLLSTRSLIIAGSVAVIPLLVSLAPPESILRQAARDRQSPDIQR